MKQYNIYDLIDALEFDDELVKDLTRMTEDEDYANEVEFDVSVTASSLSGLLNSSFIHGRSNIAPRWGEVWSDLCAFENSKLNNN